MTRQILVVTRCNGVPITRSKTMFKTKTLRLFNIPLIVLASRSRVYKSRWEFTNGSTFKGVHMGKKSYYVSVPVLASRKFGGVADIVS